MLLARQHEHVKFIRVRAAALGFAISPSISSAPRSLAHEEDAVDSDSQDELDTIKLRSTQVDRDMLPTMLCYRSGILEHNWVRVDLDVESRGGVEELLTQHRILPSSRHKSHVAGDGMSSDEDILENMTFA